MMSVCCNMAVFIYSPSLRHFFISPVINFYLSMSHSSSCHIKKEWLPFCCWKSKCYRICSQETFPAKSCDTALPGISQSDPCHIMFSSHFRPVTGNTEMIRILYGAKCYSCLLCFFNAGSHDRISNIGTDPVMTINNCRNRGLGYDFRFCKWESIIAFDILSVECQPRYSM